VTSLRICGLIVSIETRRYILSVANAVEREIFDHQRRDDLGLARDLQRSLLREQLLLPTRNVKSLICCRSSVSCTSRNHSYSLSGNQGYCESDKNVLDPVLSAQTSITSAGSKAGFSHLRSCGAPAMFRFLA